MTQIFLANLLSLNMLPSLGTAYRAYTSLFHLELINKLARLIPDELAAPSEHVLILKKAAPTLALCSLDTPYW